jgi:hypothetical protein
MSSLDHSRESLARPRTADFDSSAASFANANRSTVVACAASDGATPLSSGPADSARCAPDGDAGPGSAIATAVGCEETTPDCYDAGAAWWTSAEPPVACAGVPSAVPSVSPRPTITPKPSISPRPSLTFKPTACPAGGAGCVGLWENCADCPCCPNVGATCAYQNEHYSECVPDGPVTPAPTGPTPAPTTPAPTSPAPTTPAPTTPAPTTPPPTPAVCAALYGQCGGQDWAGPFCCADGGVCTATNEFYSQCMPAASRATNNWAIDGSTFRGR